MFNCLETTWDPSARRGWSALASFTIQALALSLLLLVPLFSIQGPPRFEWLRPVIAPQPPAPPAPPASQPPTAQTMSNMSGLHVIEPPTIPQTIAMINETEAPPAPDLDRTGVPGGTGMRGDGVLNSLGPSADWVAPPPRPTATKPFRISHIAEGNIINRVQPIYPTLARQARIQGPVQLRAIISKAGTIENLNVNSGHPMLTAAAIEAVRQWRYRPYLLNNEPVEVETEITVNFVLAGS
jgi:periplasmic protein TonB